MNSNQKELYDKIKKDVANMCGQYISNPTSDEIIIQFKEEAVKHLQENLLIYGATEAEITHTTLWDSWNFLQKSIWFILCKC